MKSMAGHGVPMSLALIAALGLLLASLGAERGEAVEPNEPLIEPSFVKDGSVDVDAVVKYFEDLYRSDSSVSVAKLIVTKPRRERTLEMKSWTRGEEKALIVIQSPAREKGTATILFGPPFALGSRWVQSSWGVS